jgi:hypothetical protein
MHNPRACPTAALCTTRALVPEIEMRFRFLLLRVGKIVGNGNGQANELKRLDEHEDEYLQRKSTEELEATRFTVHERRKYDISMSQLMMEKKVAHGEERPLRPR